MSIGNENTKHIPSVEVTHTRQHKQPYREDIQLQVPAPWLQQHLGSLTTNRELVQTAREKNKGSSLQKFLESSE